MSWERIDIVFKILSPLHIGFLLNRPGTVIARTRYYVPGKNFWGAVTAHLTKKFYQSPTPKDYFNTGEWFKKNFCFSYFYLSDGKKIFLPEYKEDEGLSLGGVSLQEFEQRVIHSRISTQISQKGAAEDDKLHEIEYINNLYENDKESVKPLYLVGAVFYKEGAIFNNSHRVESEDKALRIKGIDLFEELNLGGELNYGFGRVEQVYDIDKKLGIDEPVIVLENKKPIVGHLIYNPSLPFRGDIEIVSGRGYPSNEGVETFVCPGRKIERGQYYFVPGTVILSEKYRCIMDSWGRFKLEEDGGKKE